MATTDKLPAEFVALEPYLDWDLATEPERYAKRLATSMAEMQAFYDVAFPKLNDVIEYCDKFPLDDLPEDARTLMHLMQSLSWSRSRSRRGNSRGYPTVGRPGWS